MSGSPRKAIVADPGPDRSPIAPSCALICPTFARRFAANLP
jgi:hypothetical protein